MNLLHIFVIEIYFPLFLIYYFVYGSHGVTTCMNIFTWLVVAIYLLFGQMTLSYHEWIGYQIIHNVPTQSKLWIITVFFFCIFIRKKEEDNKGKILGIDVSFILSKLIFNGYSSSFVCQFTTRLIIKWEPTKIMNLKTVNN